MKNLKKILILSIILAILTAFFVTRFTVPSVHKFMDLKKELAQEKIDINSLKANIENLKQNKLLENNLKKINRDLENYDIEFPPEFEGEVLLIDLETFSNESLNKMLSLQLLAERETNYATPDEEKAKTKSSESNKAKQAEKPVSPVVIMEKPLEITTVAYYSQIIDFIKHIESYQRKVNIDSISTKVFEQDKMRPNPRVELKINGSIYKSTINDLPPTPTMDNTADTSSKTAKKTKTTSKKRKNKK